MSLEDTVQQADHSFSDAFAAPSTAPTSPLRHHQGTQTIAEETHGRGAPPPSPSQPRPWAEAAAIRLASGDSGITPGTGHAHRGYANVARAAEQALDIASDALAAAVQHAQHTEAAAVAEAAAAAHEAAEAAVEAAAAIDATTTGINGCAFSHASRAAHARLHGMSSSQVRCIEVLFARYASAIDGSLPLGQWHRLCLELLRQPASGELLLPVTHIIALYRLTARQLSTQALGASLCGGGEGSVHHPVSNSVLRGPAAFLTLLDLVACHWCGWNHSELVGTCSKQPLSRASRTGCCSSATSVNVLRAMAVAPPLRLSAMDTRQDHAVDAFSVYGCRAVPLPRSPDAGLLDALIDRGCVTAGASPLRLLLDRVARYARSSAARATPAAELVTMRGGECVGTLELPQDDLVRRRQHASRGASHLRYSTLDGNDVRAWRESVPA